MCSSLIQSAPGSRDLFQVDKRITIMKTEQTKTITLKIVLNEQSCRFEQGDCRKEPRRDPLCTKTKINQNS